MAETLLNDYENLSFLFPTIFHFELRGQFDLSYGESALDRYVGNYDQFQEVYAMKKAQLEAAYNKQQKEIAQ